MKICRFDGDRLGLVEGDEIVDVSAALAALPPQTWPLPMGDPLIVGWDKMRDAVVEAAKSGPRRRLDSVRLGCPVNNPTKVIGISRNRKNLSNESLNFQLTSGARRDTDPIDMFIKAPSAISGPADGVALRFPDQRNDPEVELTVIIGRRCADVPPDDALDVVFGYTIGLDMTLRIPKGSASSRKSLDTFAPIGPWIVTADEIPDPDNLSSGLAINGKTVQTANTKDLAFDVRRLIAHASSFYTLHPGDAIMVGTPVGFEPVRDGDVMVAEFERIGSMTVAVRAGR